MGAFRLLSFLLLFLSCPAAWAQYPSEAMDRMQTHVYRLCAPEMQGRGAGGAGERLAAAYVEGCLREYGLDMLTAGMSFLVCEPGKDTLSSRNVCGFLEGSDEALKSRYIVVGARLDNLGVDSLTVDGKKVPRIYPGANGNASGVSMLLELARRLSLSPLDVRRSVLFVAFGASTRLFAGAWHWLNRGFSDVGNIDAMVNLDALGAPGEGFQAYCASNPDMDALVRTVSQDIFPTLPAVVAQAPYPGDDVAFYDRHIPSIRFTTGQYPEHGTERDRPEGVDCGQMERRLEFVDAFVRKLCAAERVPAFRSGESGAAQQDAAKGKRAADTYSYAEVDVKPGFLRRDGGRSFLDKWVYSYLRYPAKAVDEGIQGRVVVNFVVDEKGNVTEVQVGRGVHPLLDAEAVRVVSASPRWQPGILRGKRVRVALSTAVDFRLERSRRGRVDINGVRVK